MFVLIGAVAALWLLTSNVQVAGLPFGVSDTPTPASAPTAVATNVPAPSPAATVVVSGTLGSGASVEVFGTGQCLNVRERPSLAGPAVDCMPDGTKLRITGGPTVADGITWWQVSRQTVASQGWVSEQFIRLAP